MREAHDAEQLRRLLVDRVAQLRALPADEVPVDRPLAELGISSVDAVSLSVELTALAGRKVPDTLLWEVPTIAALVKWLIAERAAAAPAASTPERAPAAASGAPQLVGEPIAVVGIGCRLPGGVHGPAQFWQLLVDGRQGIREVPSGRWERFVPDTPEVAETLRETIRWGGYLDDVAGFDATFFRIPSREAMAMDPQQRMVLEVAWEALEHAGIPARSLAGTATGVFLGICSGEYGFMTGADVSQVDAWTPAGAALSIAANRLSYVLDLRGPSVALDTACSSSLVAVHQACTSLRTGETDTAIAAGVNLLLAATVTVGFQRAGMLAPDGRCKPFSQAADGFGRGEGCGVVVLKRLSDAMRDGDRVLALLRASAVNSDGRSNGLFAPNPEAQQALLRRVYDQAGIDPADVDYVEPQATGTPLGDAIEARSLGAVFGRGRSPDQPLLIGSAKSNVGHLEAASGIVGLIKAALALSRDVIPPSLHFQAPNPKIDFDAEGLRVAVGAEPWPRYSGRAIAGVSAFGFGGTNAHVILEEAPRQPAARRSADTAPVVAALTDADEDRVRTTAATLADWLESRASRGVPLNDIGRTLAGRLTRGRARAAVVAADRDDLVVGLRHLAGGQPSTAVLSDGRPRARGELVWVFGRSESSWAGIGRQLLTYEPDFAAAVDELDPVLADAAGVSLRAQLDRGTLEVSSDVASVVHFGTQLALAALWRCYGAEPVAVIGVSEGEIAASVVSGVLSVEVGARLVAERAWATGVEAPGFAAAVAAAQGRHRAFVEITPCPALRGAVAKLTGDAPAPPIVEALARDADDAIAFRTALATLFVHGTDVDLRRAHAGGRVRDLPTTPWRHVRHWPDPAPRLTVPATTAPPTTTAPPAGAGIADRLAGHVAAIMGSEPDHVDRTVPLTDLGIDSLTAARVGAAVQRDFGLELPVELLVNRSTVDDVADWIAARRGAALAERPRTGRPDAGPPRPIAPRDAAERMVAHAWREALDASPVGMADHFFRLGGDWPLAEVVAAGLSHRIGVELPTGALFADPTAQAVAAVLRPHLERDAGTAMRALRAAGSAQPPLFLAHPAGGSTAVYGLLAERLGADRPVFGLERLDDPVDIEARAAHYAELIRRERPSGPYRLGGWSLGGFLAYETARLLVADGAEVDAVILIDSIRPLPAPALSPEDEARRRFAGFAEYIESAYGGRLELSYPDLGRLDDSAQIAAVISAVRAAADLPAAIMEHQRTSALDLRAGERYQPGPYGGRVVLYRATEPAPHAVQDVRYLREDAALGWDELCADLEVVHVSGHHLSLLDPPHVDELAAHLTHVLAPVPSRSVS